MPTLMIKTNAEIPPERRKILLEAASSTVSEQLGKPETYVMVILELNPDMVFGADDAPLAFLELKSLGLPEDRTKSLSRALCALVEKHFKVSPARIYIEFASPPRHMFGWNSGTF
jgi:phenylpyruvate tautomerase PptA (4-oxalocrotonate tautomerase family)